MLLSKFLRISFKKSGFLRILDNFVNATKLFPISFSAAEFFQVDRHFILTVSRKQRRIKIYLTKPVILHLQTCTLMVSFGVVLVEFVAKDPFRIQRHTNMLNTGKVNEISLISSLNVTRT